MILRMNPLAQSLIASFLIMAISCLGVIFTHSKLETWLKKYLNYLVSFSAGVFLIVAYHLISELTEHSINLPKTYFLVAIGFLIFYSLDKFIPESHHHHQDTDCHHPHSKLSAYRMMIGDSLHNIGDGILIPSAFIISSTLGWLATLSIMIHEAIQEISEFFVLRQAGYNNREALTRNFLTSTTILIGVALGFLLTHYDLILEIILSLAGGGFLYLVLVDILPRTIKEAKKLRTIKLSLICFLLGIVLVWGIEQMTIIIGLGH